MMRLVLSEVVKPYSPALNGVGVILNAMRNPFVRGVVFGVVCNISLDVLLKLQILPFENR